MSFPISITWSGGTPPVAGFQQMAAAAAKLDSALSTTVGKMDQFGSSISKMESPIGGVASGVGQLESSIGGLEGSIGGAASGMESFAGSTESLNGSISETGGFVTDATSSMSDFGSSATEAGSAATELGTATTDANTGVVELGTGSSETGGFVTDMGTATGEAVTPMTELGTATSDTNTVLGESVTALGDVVPGLQDTATGASDSAQGFSDLAPPIEDTNTALDSSSGLLEGVAPLLGTTGENAGTAATSTDDFSGALGGMNTELPGVTGGLDTANTLVGDYWPEADKSATSTGDFKDSLGLLATGLTTVVGAGYSVVNSFLGIRDAQNKLDRANLAVEKSMVAVDKSLFAVGKSIRKLATDSEAPISGLGKLNTAFSTFNDLVKSGVTSGPQYTKALNDLKTAADGLEGSTTKDKDSVEALQLAIGTLATKVGTADGKIRTATKANENWYKSMVDAGMSSATLIGGLGSMIQTVTSVGSAVGILKGGFVDLAIIMSQSVLPVLGAIAVPVGVAVAAIVGFIAAVTAIRANIKVFDDMGVAIGKVFPAMVPMLQGARQAFINFSDAINSSVSVILGGIDALTGGTLKLKEHWDGFTDTLPKGSANVNVLTEGMAGLRMALGMAGETAKQGYGKFKILNDGTLQLADGTTVAAGSYKRLDEQTVEYVKSAVQVPPAVEAQTQSLTSATTAQDAMGAAAGATGVVLKEQSANYSELSNAQKLSVQAMNNVIENLTTEKANRAMAVAEAQKYLSVIEGITPAAGLSGAAIVGMAAALSGEAQAHFEAVSAAAKYIQQKDATFLTVARTDAEILAYADTLKEEEKAAGKATEETSKHVEALNKLSTTLQETTSEIAFYSDATNAAARMQLEFNTGAAEATKKIMDETFALAKLSGELSIWSDEAKRAQLIANAFARGMLEQQQAAQKAVLALAQATGKLAEFEKQMKSGQAVLVAFNQGLVDGRTKALEFVTSLAKGAAETIAFESSLRKLVTAAGVDLQSALEMSAEQMELLIGAMVGAPDAVREVISAFDELGQEIVETLADAAKEGGKKFNEAIDQMQKDAGFKFSKPLIQKLEFEANLENATREIQTGLKVLAATLRNQPLEVALKSEAAQYALTQLRAKVDEAAKDAPAKFAPLQSALNKLATTDFSGSGITKLPGILGEVLVASQNMEGGMQGAITQFQELFDQAAQSAEGLAGLTSTFEGMGLSFDATSGIIKDASGNIVGDLQTMSEGATNSSATAVTAIDTLGPAGTAARTTLAYEMVALTFLIDKFAQETKQSAIEVSTAFANMSTNTHNSLNTMASGFIIIITAMGRAASDSQRMASTVSGSFSNMANNTRASMNTMASGFIIILTAFTNAGSRAQAMNTTVSSAFRSAASAASSFSSGMSSSMSRAGSAMDSAAGKARALQSAINALKSKTITITTVYVTVRRTVFAAAGGSFVQSNPGRVGPLSVSEFGQQELVTVTPLQSPGRQPVKGISDLIGKETEKKTKRAMTEEGEKEGKGKQKEVVMMRETPIIIQVDGREIARVVNKRIFEESDALV